MSSTTNHRAADFPRVGPEPGQGARVAPAAISIPRASTSSPERVEGGPALAASGRLQSYADRVAADVAARYGVRVTGPVQIIPRGVSGLPDAAGKLDSWMAMRDATWRNSERIRRVQAAKANENAGIVSQHDPIKERLQGFADQGMSAADIALQMGIDRRRVYDLASRHGIKLKRAAMAASKNLIAPAAPAEIAPVCAEVSPRMAQIIVTIHSRPGISGAEIGAAIYADKKAVTARNIVANTISAFRKRMAEHGWQITSNKAGGGYWLSRADGQDT